MVMKLLRLLTLFGLGLVSLWVQAAAPTAVPGVAWPATDDLGRDLPLADEVGLPKPNRFVGIFYFLWHNNRGGKSPHWNGPYDIARILQHDPEALTKPNSPLWGPIRRYHYWGEPLYGYYLSTDPWVLRRHAQLLADAAVDTLIFDTTNALTYREVYLKLCEVFQAIRAEGGRTPGIAFMVNTRAGETAGKLYRELYQPGLFRELWFHWQGKPLLICDPEKASAEWRDFFTLRRAHWPFTMVNTERAWHWEATFPQPYGYTDDPKVPEQVNVSVAQNLRRSDGKVTNMSSGEARGRSFHRGRVETRPNAVNHGYNFQEQWGRAFELDPPFVMVTGWNEWIAGRWGKPDGPLVFVDQFDQEHSRDIEPVKGNHGDNYYYQLVANIRRYKGAPEIEPASAPRTIDMEGGFAQWDDVLPLFRDHRGEVLPRDYDGAAGLRYRNSSGRYDLLFGQVARDQHRVFFRCRMGKPISTSTWPRGLFLLLDSDQDPTTGWEGYDLRVGVAGESESATLLERWVHDWQWVLVERLESRVEGRDMHVAVPRSCLGLSVGETAVSLDFKWIDNPRVPGAIMDVYVSGDAAPEGRFRYRYTGD